MRALEKERNEDEFFSAHFEMEGSRESKRDETTLPRSSLVNCSPASCEDQAIQAKASILSLLLPLSRTYVPRAFSIHQNPSLSSFHSLTFTCNASSDLERFKGGDLTNEGGRGRGRGIRVRLRSG